MSVNRCGWLLNHLQLNDNALLPNRGDFDYDKLYKIRPVLNKLCKTFKECYYPSKCVIVDESMIKFKGRSSLKQFMKDKPIKRGYKV